MPTVLSDIADETLTDAVWRTVMYTDVFDYPLSFEEVHRYLIGKKTTINQVRTALRHLVEAGRLATAEQFYMMRGRERIVATRQRRRRIADEMWPQAIHFGTRIARLPFVRMVALTGALAADNVERDADIDYLIVTEPGRLWLCRLAVIALVRRAAREGVVLCPNYFISERAMSLEVHSLFAARELAQMVPLAGLPVYKRLRAQNSWAYDWLPNSAGLPRALPLQPVPIAPNTPVERVLRTRVGGWLERWEMSRKVQKFRAQANGDLEANFSADWCKGHFDGHGQRIMAAYHERLASSTDDA